MMDYDKDNELINKVYENEITADFVRLNGKFVYALSPILTSTLISNGFLGRNWIVFIRKSSPIIFPRRNCFTFQKAES